MGKIEDILIDGNQKNASDIHLCPGSPVMFRIDGDLIPMSEEKIKPYEIEEMIKPMLTTEQLEVLEREGELDFAHSIAGACQCVPSKRNVCDGTSYPFI